ncbi:MAG TPA: VOC family protein [Rheinheimera sp.]|uniref:VOC family protein n=1 Tax=Rheinheimera sp. TaxID=1869214 RepID=UPI000ED0FFD9|nr:VOC family protein [Rheinheimera sp.]HCU66296.1 VOC family protein [Rheinheimera sp.]
MTATIINPVGWFEIPVTDMEKSKKFYQQVFQLELTMMEMASDVMALFPFDHGQSGCGGALVLGPEAKPSANGTTVYFQTADVAPVLSRVAAAGGEVVLAKTAIGEHGFIGMFFDPAGNKLGVHSMQ